jgi:hypothetical protein
MQHDNIQSDAKVQMNSGRKLTIDVKISHIWWWGKIWSYSDSMTNLAHSSQELAQQKTKNRITALI